MPDPDLTIDDRGVPYPPIDLANRVGAIVDASDPYEHFRMLGAGTKAELLAALPEGWSFAGRQVLDFGCGAGRTLRHLLDEAAAGEIWGCDIDAPSIAWLRANLCPPLHVAVNGPTPPLPFADATFDLVYAVSVFTHLTDSWSAWLLELHRIVTDGGIVVATFMGEGMSQVITGQPWDDDRTGMAVYNHDQSWDHGGPMVLHSPWWIEAHWGRLFEIDRIQPYGFLNQGVAGHGIVTLRKRAGSCTIDELEALEPHEPREGRALRATIDRLQDEVGALRAYVRSVTPEPPT